MRVRSEVRGGGEVQIGDYTWDTEDQKIVWPGNYAEETFSSLPEVWEALA